MALPPQGVSPRPERVKPGSAEGWSLGYAVRLYADDVIEAEQFEDLAGWVVDGGDLRLVTARPPWPWRGR